MVVEVIIILLVILAVIAAYYILKTVKYLIINTVLGIIVLFIANNVFNLGIEYSIFVLIVVALGGVPGALLVIILNWLFQSMF